jgi:hypothetical protein
MPLETLTQVKGQTLPSSQFFFQAGFHHPVFTQVRMGGLVFNQGITHGDTLRGSDWDAEVIPEGICDTHPTLVDT